MGSSGAITAPASPVNLTTVAAGVVLANKLAAGDANPAFQILGDGTQRWGPGGGGVSDLSLFRQGAGAMRVVGIQGLETRSATAALDLLTVSRTDNIIGQAVPADSVALGSGPAGAELDLAAEFSTQNVAIVRMLHDKIAFYGKAPVAQPAAPVTLADVIAVIRGCGLSA